MKWLQIAIFCLLPTVAWAQNTNPAAKALTFGPTTLYNGQTAPTNGQAVCNNAGKLGGCAGGGGGAIGENILNFGADPTGAADSTAAIQNAINAGCAASPPMPIIFPNGTFQLSSPIWGNCNGVALLGVGTIYSSILVPSYDFGKTGLIVGSTFPGIPTTTRLVAGDPSTYNSIDFTVDQKKYWLNLREWDGLNGPAASPSGLTLNGLSAFTAETFVRDINAADGTILSSGSQASVSAGEASAFQMRINAGAFQCLLHTSNSTYSAVGPSVALATTYYAACTYDGSDLRIYICTPGQSSCAASATTAATGTIVQDPTEDVTVGPQLGIGYPNGATNNAAVNGYIYSPRLSNTARYTGTISTAPNTAFTSDANTLIVTYGEKDSTAPFIKAYEPTGAAAVGWLFEYNTTQTGGSLSGASVQNIAIQPPHLSDVSGILFDGTHQAYGNNIALGQSGHSGGEAVVELWNIAYENWFYNLYQIGVFGAGSRYGIINNSNTNSFVNTQNFFDWACVVSDGNAAFFNRQCTQASFGTNLSAYGLLVPAGGSPTISDTGAFDDFENGGNPTTSIFASGGTNLNLTSGQYASEDSAPVLLLDSGASATVSGSKLYGYNNATQIVKTTGAAPSNVTFVNPTFAGFTNVPVTLSTTLMWCLTNTSGSACYTPSGYLSTNSNVPPITPCSALTNHQHLVTTDANTSCSAGAIPVGGGAIHCDAYCFVPGA